MNRFERDTSVVALGEGRYGVHIDRGWWIVRGPNGGYVAALMLRALEEAVGDPSRTPRAFTVHFTSPPTEGAAEVHTVRERVGRTVTTATARLTQGGKLLEKTNTAKVVKALKADAYLALSRRTMEFDGDGRCVSGCGN